LTICFPRIRWRSRGHENNSRAFLLSAQQTSRFKQLWRWYEKGVSEERSSLGVVGLQHVPGKKLKKLKKDQSALRKTFFVVMVSAGQFLVQR
jgi:hypothetical protein